MKKEEQTIKMLVGAGFNENTTLDELWNKCKFYNGNDDCDSDTDLLEALYASIQYQNDNIYEILIKYHMSEKYGKHWNYELQQWE